MTPEQAIEAITAATEVLIDAAADGGMTDLEVSDAQHVYRRLTEIRRTLSAGRGTVPPAMTYARRLLDGAAIPEPVRLAAVTALEHGAPPMTDRARDLYEAGMHEDAARAQAARESTNDRAVAGLRAFIEKERHRGR